MLFILLESMLFLEFMNLDFQSQLELESNIQQKHRIVLLRRLYLQFDWVIKFILEIFQWSVGCWLQPNVGFDSWRYVISCFVLIPSKPRCLTLRLSTLYFSILHFIIASFWSSTNIYFNLVLFNFGSQLYFILGLTS